MENTYTPGTRILLCALILALILGSSGMMYLLWCVKLMDKHALLEFVVQEHRVHKTMMEVTPMDKWVNLLWLFFGLVAGLSGVAYFADVFGGSSGTFCPSIHESLTFFPHVPSTFGHTLEYVIGFLVSGMLLTLVLWILHSVLHVSSHNPSRVDDHQKK